MRGILVPKLWPGASSELHKLAEYARAQYCNMAQFLRWLLENEVEETEEDEMEAYFILSSISKVNNEGIVCLQDGSAQKEAVRILQAASPICLFGAEQACFSKFFPLGAGRKEDAADIRTKKSTGSGT